jgi:hypothetical protein
MDGSTRFTVDETSVIHEVIDGEAVIVSLPTGTYYSAEGVGGEIWDLVAAGGSVSTAVDSLLLRYEATRPAVERAVKAFLHELVAEELLEVSPIGEPAPPAHQGGTAGNGVMRMPFVEPKLQKYTDMTEMLALDPIHNVYKKRGSP